MNIKIVSDGTGPGTHVTNAETGVEIERLMSLDFNITGDSLGVATLKFDWAGGEFTGQLSKETEDQILSMADRIKKERSNN